MLFIKKYTLIIYEKIHTHTRSYETTYSAGFMKENPGKASLGVPTRDFSFTELGTDWSVNSGSM